jgi:hypothetical protein
MRRQCTEALIIGAGQAGLPTGYHPDGRGRVSCSVGPRLGPVRRCWHD